MSRLRVAPNSKPAGRWRRASLLIGCAIAAAAPTMATAQHRSFQVKADPMTEVTTGFTKLVRDKHLPIVIRAVSLEITNEAGPSDSQDAKKRLVRGWLREASASLRDQGFDRISDRELEKASGMSKDDFRQKMLKGIPYNYRDDAAARFADFSASLNLSLPCAQARGSGVMMVVLEGTYPTEGDRSDYGGLMILGMGLGDCGDASSGSRLSDILRRVRSDFRQALRDEE